MSMPSPIGRNWPEAMRPLELRRHARVIANFAEYLAEDVRGHPDRALEAMGAIAESCEGDPELLAHARTEVLRHIRQGPEVAVETSRYAAVQLLDLVRRVS
jgi:hypothetical protein